MTGQIGQRWDVPLLRAVGHTLAGLGQITNSCQLEDMWALDRPAITPVHVFGEGRLPNLKFISTSHQGLFAGAKRDSDFTQGG